MNCLLGRRFTWNVVLIFLENNKIAFRMSSATNLFSALRVNTCSVFITDTQRSSGLHQQIPPVCVYVCLSIDLKIVTYQSKSRWQKINNGSSSVAWREIHFMKFGYIVFRIEQPLHLQSGLAHPPEQVNISEDPPPPPPTPTPTPRHQN